MKRYAAAISIVIILCVCLSLCVACGNTPTDGGENKYEGQDQYGRDYGATYAIDSTTLSGRFRVTAECSKSGKAGTSSMVDKYRLSYMTLDVKGDGTYDLIYHGTSSSCDAIYIVLDGIEKEAQLNQQDGIWNFVISGLSYDDISSTMAMKAHIPSVPSFVYSDKKPPFDCILDLQNATLVYDGELPKA